MKQPEPVFILDRINIQDQDGEQVQLMLNVRFKIFLCMMKQFKPELYSRPQVREVAQIKSNSSLQNTELETGKQSGKLVKHHGLYNFSTINELM